MTIVRVTQQLLMLARVELDAKTAKGAGTECFRDLASEEGGVRKL